MVVGGGPTGLFTAIALARRGHTVTVVEADSGPSSNGVWDRPGVMQFTLSHNFRQQAADILLAEMPDVFEGLLRAGTRIAVIPAGNGFPERPGGFLCRRQIFEEALRVGTLGESRIRIHQGVGQEVVQRNGRAVGVRVDGHVLDADLVVNATGRSAGFGSQFRARGTSAGTGMTYVTRQYELRAGAEPGPMENEFGLVRMPGGYLATIGREDNHFFTVIIGRPTVDRDLAILRDTAAFDTTVQAIPGLDVWTEPQRSRPVTPVRVVGGFRNGYTGQLSSRGRVDLPGLVHLGDAVCTTTPVAARGVSTSLMQAQRWVELVDQYPDDVEASTLAFDQWCTENIRPWVEDHFTNDPEASRRLAGADIDLSRPLTSGDIVRAATEDPAVLAVVDPYRWMNAPPATLGTVEPRVREIYATGWRPPRSPGPDREHLLDLLAFARA